jgi:hypothetical protein
LLGRMAVASATRQAQPLGGKRRRTDMSPRRLSMFAVVVIVVLAGAGLLSHRWLTADTRAADDAHDKALALWHSKEPPSYSFDYSYCSGMCMGCHLRITVEHGAVRWAHIRLGQCLTRALQHAPTIDDLFTWEERMRSAPGAGKATVLYDPTWGFPASVDVGCDPAAADCGVGFDVTNFDLKK